jgi:hypothetical protein
MCSKAATLVGQQFCVLCQLAGKAVKSRKDAARDLSTAHMAAITCVCHSTAQHHAMIAQHSRTHAGSLCSGLVLCSMRRSYPVSPLPNPPTHPPTHSLAHSLTTHPPTNPPTHPTNHPLIHSPSNPATDQPTHPPTHAHALVPSCHSQPASAHMRNAVEFLNLLSFFTLAMTR